jgi:hypothetical protein
MMLSEARQVVNLNLGVDEMMVGGFLQAMMDPTKPVTGGRVVCRASFNALAFAEAKPTPRKWVRKVEYNCVQLKPRSWTATGLSDINDGCGNADSSEG